MMRIALIVFVLILVCASPGSSDLARSERR